MTSFLDRDRAKARRNELLRTFLNMVDYAEKNAVTAVIIAGDMFDTKNISAFARSTVAEAFRKHPGISFYYLRGNHDSSDGFLDSLETIPDNLKLFSDHWTTYETGSAGIRITGAELTPENSHVLSSSLLLEPDYFNIVVLHGQLNQYQSRNDAEVIDLGSFRGKNISYLALGHIHEFRHGELPPGGVYCYPGCLEGRGFDECGEHGFVVLDIDENRADSRFRFVPFASRRLYEVKVDISGCTNTAMIAERTAAQLAKEGCTQKDLIKAVLTGSVSVDCEKNTGLLSAQLSEKYYYAKISDETRLAVNYNDYALDASLKGEFVRLISSDGSMDEDKKAEVIRCGMQVLNGEEIEL